MPFQGRVLMAWVLKVTAANPRVSPLLMRLASKLPLEMRNPYSIVLLTVDFAALLASIWAGRATLEYLTGDVSFSAWGSLLLLYMSYFNLIVGYGIYLMPYDILSLTVFVLSVWLILTERYALLLIVFALGTLNRETTLFIPVFMGLYTWFDRPAPPSATPQGRFSRGALVTAIIAAQVLIWVGLRLWVQRHFIHNPVQPDMSSRSFGLHLPQNLVSLAKPPQWPLLLSLFGFTLPLLVAKFDAIGNRAFGRATAIILLLWTLSMLLVGVIVEIRIFNELSAFVMPCVALILWNQWIKPARTMSVMESGRD